MNASSPKKFISKVFVSVISYKVSKPPSVYDMLITDLFLQLLCGYNVGTRAGISFLLCFRDYCWWAFSCTWKFIIKCSSAIDLASPWTEPDYLKICDCFWFIILILCRTLSIVWSIFDLFISFHKLVLLPSWVIWWPYTGRFYVTSNVCGYDRNHCCGLVVSVLA